RAEAAVHDQVGVDDHVGGEHQERDRAQRERGRERELAAQRAAQRAAERPAPARRVRRGPFRGGGGALAVDRLGFSHRWHRRVSAGHRGGGVGVAGGDERGGSRRTVSDARAGCQEAPRGVIGLAGCNPIGSLLRGEDPGGGVQATASAYTARTERTREGGALAPAVLRRRFADAFTVRRELYWIDVIGSAALGWGAFVASGRSESPLLTLAALAVATLALYRAVLFIHELAHLRTRAVPGLPLVWNLAVGLPLGVPSILYVGTHPDHHRRTTYGTTRDPEYEPIAHWSPLRIASSVLLMPLMPLLIAVRWTL